MADAPSRRRLLGAQPPAPPPVPMRAMLGLGARSAAETTPPPPPGRKPMQPYVPTPGQLRAQDILTGGYDFARGLTVGAEDEKDSTAAQMGELVQSGLPLVKGAGLGLAAMRGGLKVLGGADEAADAARTGIRAYHASPHDFSKFKVNPNTVGTGEGGAAYGHGLYLAEAEPVIDEYHRAFSQRGPAHRYEVQVNADPEDFLDWDKPVSAQSPQVRRITEPDLQEREFVAAAGKRLVDYTGDTLLGVKLQNELRRNGGNIHAALDTLGQVGNDTWKAKVARARNLDWSDLSPQTVYQGHLRGIETYHDLERRLGGADKASAYLQEKGIPGLRYRDQHSRFNPPERRAFELESQLGKLQHERDFLYTRPGGLGPVPADLAFQIAQAERELARVKAQRSTYNYVMFPGSEKLVDILRKYGLVPPLAGAAGYEALRQSNQRDNVGSAPPVRAPGGY